jgi:hypothetical protein
VAVVGVEEAEDGQFDHRGSMYRLDITKASIMRHSRGRSGASAVAVVVTTVRSSGRDSASAERSVAFGR